MKALVLRTEDNRRNPTVRWEDVSVPEPECGEVLIRVRACGVCGSDAHCLQTNPDGTLRYSGPIVTPVILGHEFTGEVVAAGPNVVSLRVGDLVTAEGMIGCGVCQACCEFHPNQCPALRMVGLSRPGAFAEYVTLHERFCWSLNRLAEKLGDGQAACEVGALIEPASCSYNGVFVTDGRFKPGEHVVIYGAGPIGLAAAAILRISGAATLTVFEPSARRRELALRMGADRALDPNAEGPVIHEIVAEVTHGAGADLQLECAGAATGLMAEIERSFAPAGRLIYLGRTGERSTVSLDFLVSGANKIVGSRGHVAGGCFPRVLTLLETGRLDLAPMITSRYPMAQAIDAIRRSEKLEDGKIMTYGPLD